MHIERKQISNTEIVFYFTAPLPVTGAIYADKTNIPTSLPNLLQSILDADNCCRFLLTQDFLYLQSSTAENLEEIEFLALAEIDDYTTQTTPPQITDLSVSEAKIELIMKIAVAPFLQKDGGDIALKTYQNDFAFVHFLGKCQGCPFAQNTLKEKVEKTLIHYLPQIKGAILV